MAYEHGSVEDSANDETLLAHRSFFLFFVVILSGALWDVSIILPMSGSCVWTIFSICGKTAASAVGIDEMVRV